MATKPMHNRAAKFNGRIDANRVTAEGFKRGSEVEFNLGADQMKAWYPRFKLVTQYIVISVFKPQASGQKHEEVTLRDVNGDCYGYVEARALKKFGEKNKAVFVLEGDTVTVHVAKDRPAGLQTPVATKAEVEVAALLTGNTTAKVDPAIKKGMTVTARRKDEGDDTSEYVLTGTVVSAGPANVTLKCAHRESPVALPRALHTFVIEAAPAEAPAAETAAQ